MKNIYFLGIGGIGMSALAFYFLKKGCTVSGYDHTQTPLTDRLMNAGALIHFEEDVKQIPQNVDFVVYTPAISQQHKEYLFFMKQGVPIYKRSQVLGMISEEHPTIAVAGTHGKTTTTALISHILFPECNIMAFIGGIAKNFDANFVLENKVDVVVVEADEFDRSFLTLHPATAVITSMDADHLDIYGGKQQLTESFQLFADKVQDKLIIHEAVAPQISHPHKITYGFDNTSDYYASEVSLSPDSARFTLHYKENVIHNVVIGITGMHNVLNAVAGFAAVNETAALSPTVLPFSSLTEMQIEKMASFSGVKRRFDYQIKSDDLVFIDDYAHHPAEIKALLTAVKKIFPDKKICGIFQPHLYTRTRDFAPQFAEVLSLLDRVILLDIYPAREQPIPGITSSYLLSLIRQPDKMLLTPDQLVPFLLKNKPQVLLTIGAGDIDKWVPVIRENLRTFAPSK